MKAMIGVRGADGNGDISDLVLGFMDQLDEKSGRSNGGELGCDESGGGGGVKIEEMAEYKGDVAPTVRQGGAINGDQISRSDSKYSGNQGDVTIECESGIEIRVVVVG